MCHGMTINRSDDLQLNLLKNALDFLLSAAEAVRRNDGPRSLKDAILHVSSGIELLLKARIVREHWSLIFSNIDNASQENLTKGNFTSIGFLAALDRLELIVDIPIDKSLVNHLKELRKLRNRLVHFTAILNREQANSLLAKSMVFCIDFCEQQGMHTEATEIQIGEIHRNLTALQEFVDERLEIISSQWRYATMWECPECWQETLVVDAGEASCKFCRHKSDPQELAAANSEGGVEDCPECGEELTFAFILYNNDSGGWICFACGQMGEQYDHCTLCGRMEQFPNDGDGRICESCWANRMKRG